MTDASVTTAGGVVDRPTSVPRSAGPTGEAEPPVEVVSFDTLYRTEWAGLVAFGYSLTGSWVAAEELAQDAFADAYRRWPSVGGLDRPGAWVRRAVLNRAASYHRSRASEGRGVARWSSRWSTEGDRPSADRTGDDAVNRVGDPLFWAAVRGLPLRQAACVSLHYLEDLSTSDIAAVLGCSTATVKVHLHRGRAALSRRLNPSHHDLPEDDR